MRVTARVGLNLVPLLLCCASLAEPDVAGAPHPDSPPRSVSLRTGGGNQSPSGASALDFRIEEPGDLLVAAGTARRTVIVQGARTRGLIFSWESRIDGRTSARGHQGLTMRDDGSARVPLSWPVPSVDRPVGLELLVHASHGAVPVGGAAFPFTLYPERPGEQILSRLHRSRIGVHDPDGRASEPLRSLGLQTVILPDPGSVHRFRGDLIIIGPGGFAREDEALGPILATKARTGTSILLLDQPTLPGTLTEELRLWPSFKSGPAADFLYASEHPVLLGVPAPAAEYFATFGEGGRPLFPPKRGNFRILAEVRVRNGPSWQEGLGMVEIPMGEGTILAAQTSLCADYHGNPQARILLVNSLSYLLGERKQLKRAYVYGNGVGSLPGCLAHLAPQAPRAPYNMKGIELMLVPGDWQAPQAQTRSNLPPPLLVSEFLRGGGTVILLNPEPLALDYIESVVGASVHFTPEGSPGPSLRPADLSLSMLQGIAGEDLRALEKPNRREFRLRSRIDDEMTEPLLQIPGLTSYRVGGGILVALSLPPTSECRTQRVSSLLARLLTNLGLPLESGPSPGGGELSLLHPE